MNVKNGCQLGLSVGNTVIGLNFPSAEIKSMAEDYFGVESSGEEPDITLKLHLELKSIPITIPDSLYEKKFSNGRFSISSGIIRGNFDPEKRYGELWVHFAIMNGPLVRVFEQILYQAYYSIQKIRKLDTFLIHSAGVIRNGNGYIFVGAPGTGKSTVAGLSKQYHILNDEIVLVEFLEEGISVHGTPFNGLFHGKTDGTAPLKGVYLLEHGPKHEIIVPNPTEAVMKLMSQIVPPLGLEDVMLNSMKIEMLNIAEKLVNIVPVHRLCFTPDCGFWNEIERSEVLERVLLY